MKQIFPDEYLEEVNELKKKYDFVWQIDMGAGIHRFICFNVGDNPEDLARKFVNKEGIPNYYNYILQFIYSEIEAGMKDPEHAHKFNVNYKKVTCKHFPYNGESIIFRVAKLPQIVNKIVQLNEELKINKLEGCLSEQDVVNLNTIVESITDTSIKNTSNLELLHEEQFNLIFFIISKWPRANLYPVLDILRILILFQSFQNYIKKNEIKLIDVLLERLRDENTEDVVLFVALKFICNFISIIDMENLKSYHAPIYMILEICSRRNDNNVLKIFV